MPQPSRSLHNRLGRRSLGATAALTAVLLLGGCGTPPWQVEQEAPGEPGGTSTPSSPSSSGSATAPDTEESASATSDETASEAPTLEQIVNDLASGSTRRTLTAGAASLTATYWSDLDMAGWTPDASKPVSLSLTAAVDEDTPTYLARLHVVSIARDATGALVASLPEIVDDATVAPGYAIADPFSYSTTVLVPPLEETAASVELTFSYEILIATDADGETFAKQTATDTITIAVTPSS